MALCATADRLPWIHREPHAKSGRQADDSRAALVEHSFNVKAQQHGAPRGGRADGNPEFLLGVVALIAGLVQSQSMGDGAVSRHLYAKANDGGELASDLPPESIGRDELEPLLWVRRGRRRRLRRR
jgi:hypothetical protein